MGRGVKRNSAGSGAQDAPIARGRAPIHHGSARRRARRFVDRLSEGQREVDPPKPQLVQHRASAAGTYQSQGGAALPFTDLARELQLPAPQRDGLILILQDDGRTTRAVRVAGVDGVVRGSVRPVGLPAQRLPVRGYLVNRGTLIGALDLDRLEGAAA